MTDHAAFLAVRTFLPRWRDERTAKWGTIAISALLITAILALRGYAANAADATLVLFVIPIALCALEFGARGGLVGAGVAFALLVGWEIGTLQEVGALGLATRGTAYLLVGGLLGRFVDERRALEAKVERHFELSQDLFATATFDGYFEDLNPAWTHDLGYTTDELRSQPFLEFVHPDDRERTAAEAAKLAEGIDTVSFRNRYRTADGEYRWLEWNTRTVPEERRLYATARDITLQQSAEEALRNQSDQLEQTVRERTQALEASRLEILQRLAVTAEYHDYITHEHTERVGRTAALIALQLGAPSATVALIRRSATLHDIGKVGISDAILRKPGKLTPAERETMQEHTHIGSRILEEGKFAVLRMAQVIALTHHERWDGEGYPRSLARESIPLEGRITAVADVFDALTHERPYKQAWSIADAAEEIERGSGQQFDPKVVAAFAVLEHDRLAAPIEEYDLELPPPPLLSEAAESAFPVLA